MKYNLDRRVANNTGVFLSKPLNNHKNNKNIYDYIRKEKC